MVCLNITPGEYRKSQQNARIIWQRATKGVSVVTLNLSPDRADVLSYFAEKAIHYDAVDQQPYWRLSDELLWWLLETQIFKALGPAPRILDAGGGTGRWAIRVLQAIPGAHLTLADLSPDMMAVAAKKAAALGLENRLRLLRCDLNDLGDVLSGERFDLCISFHNVLGFLADPDYTVRSLAALLVPGGQLALVVPNRYHAAWFNLQTGNLTDAIAAIDENRSRFTGNMPYLKLFTPKQLSTMIDKCGLQLRLLAGFPVLLYPGFDETQLYGSSDNITNVLGDKESFSETLRLEKLAVLESGVACRGNNLFIAASVP
jgi:SAM-dependent methyltransferase